MKYRLVVTLILTIIYSFCGAQVSNSDPARILIEQPVNFGADIQKDSWANALIDKQIRFRLEPLSEIHAFTIDEIAGFLPSISKMDLQISESSYHNVSVKAGADFVLSSRFELTRDKMIHYYFELVPVKNSKKSIVSEQTYPIEKFSFGIDSCLLGLFKGAGIKLKAESSRFFQIPVLSSNGRNIRQLGEIIYSDNSSKRPSDDQLIKDYESVITKDPYMIIGNYCCGLLCYNTKHFDKADVYIRELLEMTSIHRSLYLSLAKSYRMGGRYQEALNTVQQGLQLNISAVDFLSEKALDLEAMGQNGQAASVHSQILSLDKNRKYSLLFLAKQKNDAYDSKNAGLYALHLVRIDSTSGSGWFELGRSLFAQGFYDKAFLALVNAEKFIPKDPSVQEWLGDLYLRKQNNKEAFTHYKKATESDPDKAGLFLKAANALSLDKRPAEAIALLKTVENRFNRNDQFCKTIGLLEYSEGNYDRAYNFLSTCLKNQPSDPDVLYAMGRIYSKNGKDDMALDMFNRALPVSNDKQSCRMEIASIYMKKNDLSSAQKILSEVIAQKPVKGAYSLMGDALMKAGNSRGALLDYEKERELHGTDPSVQEKICMINFEKGLLVPAKQEFLKLLQTDPNNPSARYYLAIIALQYKDVKSAGQYLADAQKYGKGNASIFLMIGNEYTSRKMNDKAISSYQNCIVFDPRNEEAVMKLGEALDESGKDSAAAEYFVKLFSLQNVKYSAYLSRAGHLFNSLKLIDKAAKAYSLFIEKGYSDFSVNAAYAQLQYSNNKYSSVVDLLKNISGNWAKDKKLLLVLADSYCRISQYEPALPLLSTILGTDPKNKKAIELSAVAFEKTGDTRNAISMYEKYLQFSADSNFRDYAYHLAGLYEANSMTEKAISRYESNIRMNPDDIRNHEHLALLYIKEKKWEQAQKVLEAAVEYPHASPGLLKMLAQTLTTQNKNVAASEIYSQYLAKVKTDSLAWKELGRLYFAQAQYSQAFKPLQRASDFLPNDFDILYMLGKSYVETGNMSKSIAPLSRAQTLNGQSIAVLELIVRAYRELNEKSSLKLALVKWAALDPKRFDIRLELGSIYLDEKRVDDAIKILFEAVRFIPTEYKPHILLAQAYELKADDSLRLKQLNEAQHLANDNWEVHFELARYYISKDQKSEAEVHLKKSLELNTFNGRAHYEYGSILLEKGEYEKAYNELQQAVETETGKVHYVAEFAYASCMVNKRKNGLDIIKSALNTAPDDPEVLFWAGLIYKATDQKDLAKETFRRAISISPDYARCYEGLGDMYLEEVSYKSAAEYYFKAWEKGGYNEKRACKLARALAYDYKFDEAKGFLETVVARNPGNEHALYDLISVCCELGDVKDARKTLKIFKNNSEWMHLSQGRIYETEGNLEAAWVAYKVVMKLSPGNPNVHAGFGRLMLKQKEFDSAVVYISNAAATDSLNMELQLLQGRAFEGMGDLKSAFQLYSEVEARYHEHAQVYALMANVRSTEGNHPAAVKILEKGIRFCPKDYDLYYQFGHELELTDQYEPAIEAYQTALKKGRGTPIEALRNIGNIYYDKLVNNKKAKEFYKKYLKAGGKDEEVAMTIKKLEN